MRAGQKLSVPRSNRELSGLTDSVIYFFNQDAPEPVRNSREPSTLELFARDDIMRNATAHRQVVYLGMKMAKLTYASHIPLRFAYSLIAAAAFGAAVGTIFRNTYNGFAMGVFAAFLLYLLGFVAFVMRFR